jgi:hypothetical protein
MMHKVSRRVASARRNLLFTTRVFYYRIYASR